MNIDLKQLRTLLRVLEKRNVTEFEFEDETGRLRLVRGASGARIVTSEAPSEIAVTTAVAHPSSPIPSELEAAEYVTSPFVGTFYRSPTPNSPPFVELGSTVREGQTLCIVEAMKLMNEIEAESGCVIVEILAENGKPVEFGQKLFKIRKA